MDEITILRKKLIYQSWHRGCKETDIILGDFAKDSIHHLSTEELYLYQEFLSEDDWDIYAWIVGREEAPKKYQSWLISKIIEKVTPKTLNQ
jgi:antitoxin CptB